MNCFLVLLLFLFFSPSPLLLSAEDQSKKEAATGAPSILEIQKDLQEILRIHQTLQLQQLEQVREIQRITDQTKAQERLLKDFAAAREARKAARDSALIDEILRLEKLRLIREDVRQNRSRLERIQKEANPKSKR